MTTSSWSSIVVREGGFRAVLCTIHIILQLQKEQNTLEEIRLNYKHLLYLSSLKSLLMIKYELEKYRSKKPDIFDSLSLFRMMIFLECKDQEQKLKHFSPLADSRSVRGGGCCYVHRHYWQWGPALRASNFHSVGQFEIIAQHWYMHQPEPPIRNVKNFMSIHCGNLITSGEEGDTPPTTHHPVLSTLPQIQ